MTTEIDARGMLCPLPVLRLRKVLLDLPEGTEVRLLATDPAAVIDVPHFCSQGGHRLLASQGLEGGVTEYRVARGPDGARPSQNGADIPDDPASSQTGGGEADGGKAEGGAIVGGAAVGGRTV